MMKANELRVGNWVRFYGKDSIFEAQVYGVYASGPLVLSGDESVGGVFPKDCDPIPLNETWLERMGFNERPDKKITAGPRTTKNGFEGSLLSKKVFFQCDYEMNGKDLTIRIENIVHNGLESIFDKRIKYVHQAQNLYFALVGEELEIKSE